MTQSLKLAAKMKAELRESLNRTLAEVPKVMERLAETMRVRREDHGREQERLREQIKRGASGGGQRFRL